MFLAWYSFIYFSISIFLNIVLLILENDKSKKLTYFFNTVLFLPIFVFFLKYLF